MTDHLIHDSGSLQSIPISDWGPWSFQDAEFQPADGDTPEEVSPGTLAGLTVEILDAAATLELLVPVLLRLTVDATDTPRYQAGEKALNDIHTAVRTIRGLTHHARTEAS